VSDTKSEKQQSERTQGGHEDEAPQKAHKAAVAEAWTVKVLERLQKLIDQHWDRTGNIVSVTRDDSVMASYESGEAEQKESLAGSPQIKRSRRFSFVDPETQAELRGYDVFYSVLPTGEKAASGVPLWWMAQGGTLRR
jgi:hypothetical protein